MLHFTLFTVLFNLKVPQKLCEVKIRTTYQKVKLNSAKLFKLNSPRKLPKCTYSKIPKCTYSKIRNVDFHHHVNNWAIQFLNNTNIVRLRTQKWIKPVLALYQWLSKTETSPIQTLLSWDRLNSKASFITITELSEHKITN